MSNFVGHAPCPKCGSRDNLGVWDDGHKYCFSSGCDYCESVDGTKHYVVGDGKKFFKLPYLVTLDGYERAISPKTYAKYRVGVTDTEYTSSLVFPYYLNGNCVGAKFRSINKWEQKEFWYKGESLGLFGLHTCDKKKGVIITEGEFDALAAYEMHGYTYSCISVAHGAKGAKKDISEHIEWLNATFEKIFICFDMDEPGSEAVDEVLPLFRAGKAKRVILPNGFKDANDMLIAGKLQEFRDSVEAAQGMEIPGFMSKEELKSEAFLARQNPDFFKGKSTGYTKLDELVGGIKDGEIVVLAGGTGVGKTAFTRQIVYNVTKLGLKTLWLSLEMPPRRVLEQFVEHHLGKPYSINGALNVSEEEVSKAEDFILDKVTIYKNYGSMTADRLMDVLTHAKLVYGVDLIVIDHLAILTSNQDYKQIDGLMNSINSAVLDYNLSVLAVAQISSTGNIRGSWGIPQIASAVIFLERSNKTSVLRVYTDKAYRYSPVGYGEFYLDYDKETRTFINISNREAQAKIQSDTNNWRGGEEEGNVERQSLSTKWSKHVREANPKAKSEFAVELRADEDSVHSESQLCSRLLAHYQKRKAYLCGSEGVLSTTGQEEDASGEGAIQTLSLQAAISELDKKVKS